ncbi:MAG: response regulator [Pseudomonadales bacterium]
MVARARPRNPFLEPGAEKFRIGSPRRDGHADPIADTRVIGAAWRLAPGFPWATFVGQNGLPRNIGTVLPDQIPPNGPPPGPAAETNQVMLFGRAVRDSAIPTAFAFSLFYALVSISHWRTIIPPHNVTLGVLTATTAILFLILGWRWRYRTPPTESVVTIITIILVINNITAIGVADREDAYYGQLLSQLAIALFGLSWWRFAGLSLLISLPILTGLLISDFSGDWRIRASNWGSAVMLSLILHLLTIRFREHLNAAQAESEQQRLAAESNLARFREEAAHREALQDQLAHAERLQSLGMLAGGVAHDFNNLLAVIIGRASILQREMGDDPRREGIDDIIDAGERAALLARELLAYAGRSTRIVAPLDLNTEVRGICALARSSLPSGVELELQESGNGVIVDADRGQLQQIVLNLVMNAADATRSGGGRIRVTTGHCHLTAEEASHLEPLMTRPGGAFCFLKVSDDGEGMSSEVRRHVFDPFYTTKPTGRGLGLAAALGIARAHGGGFAVISQPARGSEFTLFLPWRDAAPAPPPDATADIAFHASPVVLVVDDMEPVRATTGKLIETCGYRVVLVDGGEAALRVLDRGQQVDLAIVDMSMPGMSGEATLRALRARQPDLPVLLSSGFDAHEATVRLGGMPGVDFLAKPYQLHQLRTKLDTLLQGTAVGQHGDEQT